MEVRDVLPRDAIQSIDEPRFEATYFGAAADEVIIVEHGDGARAYPVRILNAHEVVNDGEVAVTWCPICGSAVVCDTLPGLTGEASRGSDGTPVDSDGWESTVPARRQW